MKRQLLRFAWRVLVALILLAGTTYTFNFGLQDVLNPATLYSGFISHLPGYEEPPDVIVPSGPEAIMRLLALLAVALILWALIRDFFTGEQPTIARQGEIPQIWATPSPHWANASIDTSRKKRAKVSGSRKKLRL